jgi:hypothetical protein
MGGIDVELVVYLAGEIHSEWRSELKEKATDLPFTFVLRTYITQLKELSNKANVTVETVDQALKVLKYVFE